MQRLFLVPATLSGLAILSCQAPPEADRPSLEEDLSSIAEARTALIDALAEDDLEGIMAQLTDEHLTMAPGGPTPPGNAELAEWHQARIDEYSVRADFVTDDIQVHGDIAIERWSNRFTLIPKDGTAETQDELKGIWIWERQPDESWKLMWSVWNSNLPA